MNKNQNFGANHLESTIQEIHTYIGQRLGRTILEEVGGYDQKSGITQNMSEVIMLRGFITVFTHFLSRLIFYLEVFLYIIYKHT